MILEPCAQGHVVHMKSPTENVVENHNGIHNISKTNLLIWGKLHSSH